MSENTHYLNVPFIMPSQAQKHVTHNEALRMLDAIIHLSVISSEVNTVPSTPGEGDRYVIGGSPTDEWENLAGQIAAFIDGAWLHIKPGKGWLVWDQSASRLIVYTGTGWEPVVNEGPQTIPLLGINGTASDFERLVVQSSSSLLNHDGTDHRLKLNKASASDTASLLFQTGYSGRVEFGLPGSDDFVLKVSENGADWYEAIRIDKSNGAISFPASSVDILSSYGTNLLPDSGRFHSSASQDQIHSTNAESPSYIVATNGASLSFPLKFTDDNSSFGGSSGSLDLIVEELITTIFGAAGRRYGTEFWCMHVASGSGTYWNWQYNSEQFYNATLVNKVPRPEKYTTGFFVRSEAGKLAVRASDNKTHKLYRDGGLISPWTSDVIVEPENGWQYFEMQVLNTDGSHDETDLSVMLTPGGSGYFALPRIVAGWKKIGGDVAVVPNGHIFGS